jgi:hypothetical protein
MNKSIQQNPLYFLVRTIFLILAGRLHFPRERVGEVIETEDGKRFAIFRHAIVDPTVSDLREPKAIFIVRFRVANLLPTQNTLFSLLPIPFFIGLPGFRTKFWMLDESSGEFQGMYEWDTVKDATNYSNSYAMKFMVRRSIPGSINSQIVSADPETSAVRTR